LTVARSPLGERCSLTNGLAGGATPLAGRCIGHCSRFVSVPKEARERNEGARVRGGADRSTSFDAPRTAHDCPSEMDGLQRLGLNKAQVGEENAGLGLRCDLWSLRGAGWTGIGLWAGFQFMNFKLVLFSETSISLVN
jgi:hypothetical protein